MKKVTTKQESLKAIQIKKIPIYFPIGFFLLTTMIFFWGQLSGSTFFWEDFAEYVFPIQSFAARESAGGSIPFWNPYIFSGMPFLADLQTGFFYPFNRLLNFFVNSNGELSIWGLQFITIIHFFIAQLSFYFLIIYYKKSQLSAIVGSVSYAFSAIMVFHVIHPMMIYHLAWFPLVLLFFDKGIQTANFRNGIIAGLILGTSLLAGHPQTSLYLFTFLFAYFIWIVIFKWKNENLKIKDLIFVKLPGILTFVVAVGIFSIQYLPSRELADNAVRSESSYEKSSEGSLELTQIASAVIPNLFGKVTPNEQNTFPFNLTLKQDKQAPYYYYWETSFYFGISVLILGIFGFITNFNDKKIQLFLILSILGFLYSLGSNFFLHGILYNVPFFNLFRMPARMMMFVVLAFSISASFGLDSLIKVDKNRLKDIVYASSIPVLIAILGLSGVLGSLINLPTSSSGNVSNASLISLLIASITFAIMYLLNKSKINYYMAGSVLALIIFIDLYIGHSPFNSSKQDIKQSYTINEQLKSGFKNQDIAEMFRVNTRSYNPPFMATNRNQGMVDQFQNTEGYNPLVLARVNPPVGSADLIYDLLNVKYEIRFDENNRQPYFYENVNRLPRAWMVHKYHIFNAGNVKNEMEKGNYDYSKEVILEENPNLKQSYEDDSTSTKKVILREYKNNYIRLEVLDTSKDGILVLSEIWYPAWIVSIDGLPAKLYRANYSLRAIAVPKGASNIELRFASQSFAVGQWIAILTLLISIPLLLIGKFNNRNKNEA